MLVKELMQLYKDYMNELGLHSKDVAPAVGVDRKTIENYLRRKSYMPIEKQLLFITYVNNIIDDQKSDLKKLSQLFILNYDNLNAIPVSVDLDTLSQSEIIINHIKEIEQKFSLTLFDNLFDDDFRLFRFALNHNDFKEFITELTKLFDENKTLTYLAKEQDELYFNTILEHDKHIIIQETKKYIERPDKYNPELNQKISNNKNAIKTLCENFVQKLALDYAEKKFENQ